MPARGRASRGGLGRIHLSIGNGFGEHDFGPSHPRWDEKYRAYLDPHNPQEILYPELIKLQWGFEPFESLYDNDSAEVRSMDEIMADQLMKLPWATNA